MKIDNYKKFTSETDKLINDIHSSARILENYNLSIITKQKINLNYKINLSEHSITDLNSIVWDLFDLFR